VSLFKCHRPNGIGIAFVERVTFGLQSLSSSKRIDVKNDIMPVGDSEAFFQRFDENPFHQFIGLSVADIADDYACLRLTVTETTPTGIGGSVNGGVLATMVDMAAVAAVFSKALPGSVPAGTADLSITYLRQAHGQWLEAKARVIKRGRQLSTVAIDIENDEGRLCSTGQVLYAMRIGTDA
jgi:uncharacterized protein (TIGR00369 family)